MLRRLTISPIDAACSRRLRPKAFGCCARRLKAARGDFVDAALAYVRFAIDHPGHYAVMFDRSLVDAADVDLRAAQAAAGAELSRGVATLADPQRKAGSRGRRTCRVVARARIRDVLAEPRGARRRRRGRSDGRQSTGSRGCSSTGRFALHLVGVYVTVRTPAVATLGVCAGQLIVSISGIRDRTFADVSDFCTCWNRAAVPVSLLVTPRLARGYRLSDDAETAEWLRSRREHGDASSCTATTLRRPKRRPEFAIAAGS